MVQYSGSAGAGTLLAGITVSGLAGFGIAGSGSIVAGLLVATGPAFAQTSQQCAGLAFDQSGNGAFIVGAFNLVPGDTLNVTITADSAVVTTISFLGQQFSVQGAGTLTLVAPDTGAFVSGVLDAISIGGPARVQVSCTAAGGDGIRNGAEQTRSEADGNTQQLAGNARVDVLISEIPDALPPSLDDVIAEADRLADDVQLAPAPEPADRQFTRETLAEARAQVLVLFAEQQAEITALEERLAAAERAFDEERDNALQGVDDAFQGQRAALVEQLDNVTGASEQAEARRNELRVRLANLASAQEDALENAEAGIDRQPRREARQLLDLAQSKMEDLVDRLEKLEKAERRLIQIDVANFSSDPAGFRLSATRGDRHSHVGFSWSLQRLRQSEAARQDRRPARLGMAGSGQVAGGAALPGLLADDRLNAWLQGSWSFTNDNRTGVQGDDSAVRLDGGVTYRIRPRAALGGKFRYRTARSDRDDGSRSADTNGLGGALFGQLGLPGGLVLTPVFAWERSSTDLDLTAAGNTVSSTFVSDVFTVGAGLSKRFRMGAYWVEPNAALSYVTAIRDDHVRSDGAAIDGATIVQGTAVLGPQFGRRIYRPLAGVRHIDPTVGFNGVWTFRDGGDFVSANGTIVRPVRLSGALNMGMTARLDQGGRLAFGASWSGIGSDVQGGSLTARFTLPLQ